MAIYIHKRFDRRFKKIDLSDAELCIAAWEVMRGEFEADLGGGVLKKRVAISAGKSGGARSVVFFKRHNNLFFYDGWCKGCLNKKSVKEIEDDQLIIYRHLAKGYLQADAQAISLLKQSGTFREVDCREKPAH